MRSYSEELNDFTRVYVGVHIGVYQPWYSVQFGNTWSN